MYYARIINDDKYSMIDDTTIIKGLFQVAVICVLELSRIFYLQIFPCLKSRIFLCLKINNIFLKDIY